MSMCQTMLKSKDNIKKIEQGLEKITKLSRDQKDKPIFVELEEDGPKNAPMSKSDFVTIGNIHSDSTGLERKTKVENEDLLQLDIGPASIENIIPEIPVEQHINMPPQRSKSGRLNIFD